MVPVKTMMIDREYDAPIICRARARKMLALSCTIC